MKKKLLILFVLIFCTQLFAQTTARRPGTNEQVTSYGGAGGGDCGGGGCTYTALSTWEGATDTDHVTDTETDVLECYDDAANFDDKITIQGGTNDATHFRMIRAASGEGHDGTSVNGIYFLNTADANMFDINGETDIQLQDLIITSSINATNTRNIVVARNTSTTCIFVGLIVFDNANAGSGSIRQGIGLESSACKAIICLVENSEGDGISVNPGAGNSAFIYNCTIVTSGDKGVEYVSGTAVCKNVISDTNGGAEFDTGGTYTGSNNNASSDGAATGGGADRVSQTFTYVNSGGNDFHLDAADGGGDNFGQDLGGDGTFAFDDDIDVSGGAGGGTIGELFDTWDIGFDENDVAAAARRIFIIGMNSYN